MNEAAEIAEVRDLEVKDLGERAPFILKAANRNLRETALVGEREWSENDVERVKQFLIEASPYAHEKIRPSYWEHILLASIYARSIAERVASPSIRPYEAQTLALLHDVG